MRKRKLRECKITKEIAYQLMWALENDLISYALERNLKLHFSVLLSCVVYVKLLLPKEVSKNFEKYDIDAFDVDILWIDHKDILWTILNYQSEVKKAKERIDCVFEKIRKTKR